MDTTQLFNDKAHLYEQARPVYPQEIFRYLAALCPSKQLAWDSACGNGQAVIGLAEEFDRVYATDISAEQIRNAKSHTNIIYALSPSEQVALDNHSGDLVCVAQALHWFDYDRFWPEVKRVLKPGGLFCALGYNFPSVDATIDATIEASLYKIIAPYWAPQNQLLWNHYRDLNIPFKKIDTPTFSLTTQWNLMAYMNFLHTFSATRRCMEHQGSDFFEDAFKKVAACWSNPDETKMIQFDFVFYLGRNE